MHWDVTKTPEDTAGAIMEKDRLLLENIGNCVDPILHFYRWKGPSITYGHFIDPDKFFHRKKAEELGFALAKRPTGGGIIFHVWDLAFSALVPASHPMFSDNPLHNYAMINRRVLAAIEEFLQERGCELTLEDGAILGEGCAHFCMAKPTKYDVLLRGKKIVGAAQRKTKNGFLHQGSISLVMPSPEVLNSVLLRPSNIIEAMQWYTFPLLGKEVEEDQISFCKDRIENILLKHCSREDI